MRPSISPEGDTAYLDEIHDDSVLAVSGFNLATTPEFLILELYKKYQATGHPRSLFLETDALPASPGRALDLVLKDMSESGDYGFIKGMLVPFMGFSPYLQKMTLEDRFQVYGWPIGITAYWFREVASGRPGLLTKIGIDTFLDPDQDSGTLNEAAARNRMCYSTKIDLSGEEFLIYRAPKPNVSFIRVTSSDRLGNLSMEDEPIRGTVMSIAQASKAMPNPGKVVAQVKRVVADGAFSPRQVEVPYPLVDYVVTSPPQYHWQASSFEYDPRACFRVSPGNTDRMLGDMGASKSPQLHRIIARRVALELIQLLNSKGSPILINLGVGVPALLSGIISEEGLSKDVVSVVESGPWGGVALTGPDFGISMGAFALSTIPDMFSNYEGGIIDTASLGFLQVDQKGNVNPSYIPGKLTGPGGFPVIAEGTPRVYFAGTFTAGKSDITVENGKLNIRSDGEVLKFVNRVYKIFFSGKQAMKFTKEVRYFTERAIFTLTGNGLRLDEVAPGVDLDRDILGRMEFRPMVSRELKEIPPVVLSGNRMNLKYMITHH